MPELLKLTDDNYFSQEADQQYMSVSQFKSFIPAYNGCEAAAMAKLNGIWKEEDSTALLVGSYFHSHFEGALDKFKQEHPEIFTKQGTLKTEYKKANDMINCLETDENFKQIYVGEKEKIFTFKLFGVWWKIKVDDLNKKDGYFVDLKTTKDFERQWSEEQRKRVSFVEKFGYIIQMAVYREGIKIVTGIDDPDGFIIAVTKQDPPDKMVLQFLKEDYEEGLAIVENNINHVLDVKEGRTAPQRCERCNYCRATKKLDHATYWRDL